MTATKGNGPGAANDRPAKTQTKYATYFIAQCARPASPTAGFRINSGAGIGQHLQSANDPWLMANAANLANLANESGWPKYRAVSRCDRIQATPEMGPVLENIVIDSGAFTHALSWVFSRQEFFDTGFPVSHGFGRDGLVRKAGRMALSMFSTSCPPVALEKAASGLSVSFRSRNP